MSGLVHDRQEDVSDLVQDRQENVSDLVHDNVSDLVHDIQELEDVSGLVQDHT